jgi:hypothetical protein
MARQWSSAVFLRYPSCGINELAAFRRTTRAAAHGEYTAGQLEHLLMRTVSGEEWRLAGRVQLDAVRVRDHLDEAGRELFDAWQRDGSLPSSATGDQRFPANAQDPPLLT